MKEHILPKTGTLTRIGLLEEADLPDVLALLDATRAALSADSKNFVLPQQPDYFLNFLKRKKGVMVGIRAGNTLIAQMVLMGPLDLSEAIVTHSISGNDGPFHHAALTDGVVVMKSMAAHPEWHGNNLAKTLISYGLHMPLTQRAAHVFAQISVANKRSWIAFVHQGFGIVAAAYDPKDGLPRFVLQKPAFGFDLAQTFSVDDVDAQTDFPAILKLTQREALVGICDQGDEEKLAFRRNRETLALMPTLARVTSAR